MEKKLRWLEIGDLLNKMTRGIIKKFYEKRKCVVCGEIFYVRIKSRKSGGIPPFLRPRSSKTCSKKCGIIYRDRNYNCKI